MKTPTFWISLLVTFFLFNSQDAIASSITSAQDGSWNMTTTWNSSSKIFKNPL